jgi:hypothetical protein
MCFNNPQFQLHLWSTGPKALLEFSELQIGQAAHTVTIFLKPEIGKADMQSKICGISDKTCNCELSAQNVMLMPRF